MNRPARTLLAIACSVVMGTLAFSGAASADPPTATAKAVKMGPGVEAKGKIDGKPKTVQTNQLGLEFKGQEPVVAYCIDITQPLAKDRQYNEADWEKATHISKQNLAKIHWVLRSSYPTKTPAEVIEAAGVEPIADAGQAKMIAYGGTQIAIWMLSDNFTDIETEPRVKKIADYLFKSAKDTPEPEPFLRIEGSASTGPAATKIGPFTVRTSAKTVTLTATGGTAVDATGSPVSTLGDNGQFWVTAPAAGTVTVKATGKVNVPVGRVFIFDESASRTMSTPEGKQKLILGGAVSRDIEASAQVTVTVTPAGPSLPQTGADTFTYIASGTGLVAVGTIIFMVAHRRRAQLRRMASL